MADNTNNILNYGRIKYYEPNELFGGDNIPVDQEDLTKYVNLSVRIPSRFYNGSNFQKKYDSILNGTPFIEKDENNNEYSKIYLTDNYVNVSYNEYHADGNISAGELFGINSIDISFDVQFFPQVVINFTDVKGFGLMSTMEHNYNEGKINNLSAKSFFTSLFNFPYPIFNLEVKGYYGKSVSFDLSLFDFHTAFDSQTGNFKTTVKFIGHMYGVYADIPMSYLMVSPYIDYNEGFNQVGTTTDPVGDVWKNINVTGVTTYLSLLRNFNSFLRNINSNTDEGFSIVNTFVDNNNRKANLEAILTYLKSIKRICITSREQHININELHENDIAFILNRENECPDLAERFIEYKELLELINNDVRNKKYEPTVIHVDSNEKCIWKFSNLDNLIYECEYEINVLSHDINNNREIVNENLLEKVKDIMGINPNIKNIYKMLFTHLNCFSKHFFNTINNIGNRTLQSCGLLNIETDVPLNSIPYENTNVPPFPAIFTTSGGERIIKYPGEINLFSTQPEIILTENIFKAINYFGQTSVEQINELEQTRQEIVEEIVTTKGLFFMDSSNVLENNLKHYSIVRPTNTTFPYSYAGENDTGDRYNSDGEVINGGPRSAKRSETIRDIFLSRLATFGRLHYMSGSTYTNYNDEHIAKVEADLLCSVYNTLSTGNNRLVLESLREMIRNENSGLTINRYNVLSGGAINGDLWGFVNYRPDLEGQINDNNITTYAENGIIHYNGYSGSTIVIYDSGMTIDEAEEIYNGIDFYEDYKVRSDAEFKKSENENYNVFFVNESSSIQKNSGGMFFDNAQSASTRFNRVAVRGDDEYLSPDYNWGKISASTVGNEDVIKFITEKYKYISCTQDIFTTCAVFEKNKYIDQIYDENFYGYYFWDVEEKINNVNNLNRIALMNVCPILAIKDTKFSIIDKYGDDIIGYTAIPLKALGSNYNEDFKSEFISGVETSKYIDDFYSTIYDEYKDKSVDEINDKYLVFAKCIQYERSGENRLNNEKIWEIWKKFVCNVLTHFGEECEETSTSISRSIDRREADKQLKNDIYYTLKTLYDKWYCGLDESYFNIENDESEFHKMHYLTTTFTDISETMIVDLESLVNQVSSAVLNADGSSQSVISFIAKTAQDNNSSFLALPMKLQWGGTENEINSIFKPYNFYNDTCEHDFHGTSYIIMYNGDVSHHLAINGSEYTNDGYDIANYTGGQLEPTPEASSLFVENENSYTVPAFGVTFAMQNQNFFKNISVDTTNPSITDYSIANTLIISQNGSSAGAPNNITTVKSLYPIYANRSYTCTVEMLGCMYITPLLYFQLNNIPMFRGAYMITNVHHRITPNDFTTTFSGVRVSKYRIPINTNVISLTSLLRNISNNPTQTTNNGSTITSVTPAQVNIDISGDTLNLDKNGQHFLGYYGSQNHCKYVDDCDNSARSTMRNLLRDLGYTDIDPCGRDGGSADRAIRLVSEKHESINNTLVATGDNNLYYYTSPGISMKQKYRETIELIKQHLYRGYPVRVAVNHTIDRNPLINEGTSEHFVTIYAHGVKTEHNYYDYTNYYYNTLKDLVTEDIKSKDFVHFDDEKDTSGSVEYFRFYETGKNLVSDAVKSSHIFIYVDDENPLFYCPSDWKGRSLTVTMVFPYSDNIIDSAEHLSFELVNYTTPPHWNSYEVVPIEKYDDIS